MNRLVGVYVGSDLPGQTDRFRQSFFNGIKQRDTKRLIYVLQIIVFTLKFGKCRLGSGLSWGSTNVLSDESNHHHHHHHHHLSLNREGSWGTTGDFATSFLQFSLFSTALWDLANSRIVHSLMLSSHLFLCLPCLLPPFTVPCKMVLARPDERQT